MSRLLTDDEIRQINRDFAAAAPRARAGVEAMRDFMKSAEVAVRAMDLKHRRGIDRAKRVARSIAVRDYITMRFD